MTDIPEKVPVDYLQYRMSYNADNGKLYWKHRPESDFCTSRIYKNWTARFSGKEALVTLGQQGYLCGEIAYKGKRFSILAHVAVWAIVTGEYPRNEIDHVDGCRTNNVFSNLRDITRTQNIWNTVKSGKYLPGSSPSGQRWKSSVHSNGRVIYLGTFPTEEDAHRAYCNKLNEIRGEFSPVERFRAR